MKKFKCLLLIIPFVLSSCGRKLPEQVTIAFNQLSGSIHTDAQKAFINASSSERDELIYQMGKSSLSAPNPISFSWKETNDTNDKADSYNVYISENQSLNNPLKYSINQESIDIYNLKINSKYYYQIESIHGDKTFSSDISSFTINSCGPRNIFIEGVENVRDLGGWNIAGEKTFKQGMIYRTAQFNYGGSKNDYVSAPTEKGKDELLNVLKIKTEIDLRRTIASFDTDEVNGITSSPLGESVKYIQTPMIYSGSNIFTNSKNKSSIQAFFLALADESNYPIAFHCMRGTDRTGALAYAIGALVGMSEEDLMLDYLFSNFANLNSNHVRESTINGTGFYVYGIAHAEGNSISEKAKNYLHEKCDIEFSTLDKIINLLTD